MFVADALAISELLEHWETCLSSSKVETFSDSLVRAYATVTVASHSASLRLRYRGASVHRAGLPALSGAEERESRNTRMTVAR